jgi:primosomal replication protein N
MANYILDKAYEVTDTGGVSSYRVVVQGTNAGQCALPGAANAPKILGVTVHAQTLKGQNVAVRKAGIARVAAAGAIALGVPVNVAGTTGKIKAINETSGTKINCVGFAETAASADGDIIEVFLSFHERTAP